MGRGRVHKNQGFVIEAERAFPTSFGLSRAGVERRKFLGDLGRWGVATAVLGLGSEAAMQAVLKRSALAGALAAGELPVTGSGIDLPPIPADQNPPAAPTPTGTIYWVATNGSDSNTGTEASPFRTLKKAHDVVGTNGGIYLKAGYYTLGEFGEVISRISWSKSDVIVRGAPGTTRDTVTVQGGSGGGPVISLVANPTRNVHFYGITFKGGPDPADPAWLPSNPDSTINGWKSSNWKEDIFWASYYENCSFVACRFQNYFYRGILQNRRDVPVSNGNEIAYCEFRYCGYHTAGADISFGINAGHTHVHHNELHGGVDGVVWHSARLGAVIEFNHIYDQVREDGIDVKSVSENAGIVGGGRITVRNNIIHDCYQQAIMLQRGGNKVDIYDNLIYNNGEGRLDRNPDGGAVVSCILIIPNEADSQIGDFLISNNEIYGNTGSAIHIASTSTAPHPDNITITNNKIYDNGRFGINIAAGTNLKVTGNILSNNAGNNGTGKEQYNNTRISQTDSDNNTAYLLDSSYRWGRSGSPFTLAEWQSAFNRDRNSTVISGRFEQSPPPTPPIGIQVTDSTNLNAGVGQPT